MTYSALTATASIMRAGNEDVLTTAKYTDADLLLISKEAAKLEMRLDIEAALAIEYDEDGTILDTVTDNFSTRLARALSYKQLALFYQLNNTGVDTKNGQRWEYYSGLYEQSRKGFSALQNKTAPTSVSSTPIWR